MSVGIPRPTRFGSAGRLGQFYCTNGKRFDECDSLIDGGGAASSPNITLVKKVHANGDFCKKCVDVQDQLDKSGNMRHINETVVAYENEPDGRGMQLAKELSVDRAPFFIVTHPDGGRDVYTQYFKFVKEVLKCQVSKKGEKQELAKRAIDMLV